MLTLRNTKGSPLTNVEIDANFSGLADGSLLTGLSASTGSALSGFSHTPVAAAGTVAAKLQQIVNVNDAPYNAKGDGVTDDTSSIQAAINSGAGTITGVSGNTYAITSSLTVISNNQILDFNNSTLNLNDATGLKDHLILGNQASQKTSIKIRRVVFTRTQAATAGAAINAIFVGVLDLDDVRVFGNSRIYNGFILNKVIIANLNKFYVQNTVSDGIILSGTNSTTNATSDVSFGIGRIDSCGGQGINCGDFVNGVHLSHETIIYNCTGAGFLGSASALANKCQALRLDGVFDTCNIGASFQNTTNINMTGCWSANNTAQGIKVGSAVTGFVLSGSQLYGKAGQTVLDLQGTDMVIGTNYMSGGANGAVLAATAVRTQLVGNTIVNFTGNGIDLTANPDQVVIGQNAYSNNGTNVTTGGTNIKDTTLLNTYQEASWTPVLTFATPGDLNVAYTTQLGKYIKIGKLVLLSCDIVTSTFTHTTASGNCQITGIPFQSNATIVNFGCGRWQGVTKANYTDINAQLGASSVLMLLRASGSAQTSANLTTADMPTGGTVVLSFTVTYEAAS